MSDVVHTAADTFSRGQNHCGGVAFSPCGQSPVPAPEGPRRQRQACASRSAPCAGRRPVGVRHQHRRCPRPRPRTTFDRPFLGCTYRSTLTGNGGRGQVQRLVVLDGDHPRSVDNTLGPDSAVVPGLPRAPLRQLRRPAPGPQVAVQSPLSARSAASGHLPLGLAQFGGATPPMPEKGQSGRCGPTRTLSPPSAAQHWRSSQAMSRTSPTPRPRPYLPMAEATGFSGAFR
jgi:hypothetical protein